MKFGTLRIIVAAVIFIGLAACIIFGIATGTLCGFGWDGLAALCPLGAIFSMVASKTIIPQALVCVALAIVIILLIGRAFCGWACPVSLWNRVIRFFRPIKKREAQEAAEQKRNIDIATCEIEKSKGRACQSCGACARGHKKLDSRHAVLGGSILATAIFGFPVFCLVCPVGLSFATVAILVGLFGAGDLNWSLLFAPAVLVLEIVFLRKWCSRFCPISALFSLVGRFSKTGLPEIDNTKCLETSEGVACSRCATVCTYDVNMRHPEYGELPLHDCARCMECVDACPAGAISIRLLNKKPEEFAVRAEVDKLDRV